MGARFKDLTGLRVGMLEVVSYEDRGEKGRARWLCRCVCGNEVVRYGCKLTTAKRLKQRAHCGCTNGKKTHGNTISHKELFYKWCNMRRRCHDPCNQDYHSYGGRGISICEEWLDFGVFCEWAIYSGWREGLTIERIDVNGDYCPENCTWIENSLQPMNKRNSLILEHDGRAMHISDWAKEIGISRATIWARIKNQGWSVEKALSEPLRNQK